MENKEKREPFYIEVNCEEHGRRILDELIIKGYKLLYDDDYYIECKSLILAGNLPNVYRLDGGNSVIVYDKWDTPYVIKHFKNYDKVTLREFLTY